MAFPSDSYYPPFVPDECADDATDASRQTQESDACCTLNDDKAEVARLRLVYEKQYQWFRDAVTSPPDGVGRDQWGVLGDVEYYKTIETAAPKRYRMVTVWEHRDGNDWTTGEKSQTLLSPGIYAGFALCRAAKTAANPPEPSIWVAWSWDEASSRWVGGAKRCDKGRGGKTGYSDDIFIHAGSIPDHFEGCISIGNETIERDWGFTSYGDAREVLWEIMTDAGVVRADWISGANPAGTEGWPSSADDARWFLIHVEDGGGVTSATASVELRPDGGVSDPDADLGECSPN
ncbi:MAG: hypothetical protein HRF50_11635 [Phycisphaerae bacterium]|jgi:hypothetical protein